MGLDELFRARNINVSAFARSVGVKPHTVYAITSGKNDIRKLNVDTFLRIARGLGMTAEQLFHAVVELEDDDQA